MLFEFNFDIFRRGFILTEKKKAKRGQEKEGVVRATAPVGDWAL